MNLQVEPLDTHEVRMTIGIDAADVEKARRDTARSLGRQIRIPGFRPGNAPMNLVISAMGGESAFMSEVANTLANTFYPKALDASKIEPYGPGAIEDVKNDPFALIAKVPLEPTVSLTDYASIRVPVAPIEVTGEEVEKELEAIRENNAVIEMVERPAQMGDQVEAQIVGKDGEEIVFSNSARRGVVVDPEKFGLPGIAEALVGMSANDHKHVDIVMPDDFETEALRGKTVDVHIEVSRVSSRTLPEIDDALAQAASSFGTLEELRADLHKQITNYKQRQADSDYAVAVLDAFSDKADVKYPPQFVNDRLDALLSEYKEDVERDTQVPWAEFLRITGRTEAQVRDELRPQAERRGRRGLVMRELGRIETLGVSDEEIASEVESTALRYGPRQGEVRKLLANEDQRDNVRNNLLSNKVIARMVAIARGEG
jgi:trigger factor